MHILFDTKRNKYTVRIPKQKLTHTSVDSVMDEEYPEHITEYIFKRAELATAGLDMPNVKIRLFDIVRGTGELKSTFKFDYKGREYTTLSLSEKTLAGIEISAMIRRITGKDTENIFLLSKRLILQNSSISTLTHTGSRRFG